METKVKYKNKIILCITVLLMIIGLTGCVGTHEPDMTENEIRSVIESLLQSKYDKEFTVREVDSWTPAGDGWLPIQPSGHDISAIVYPKDNSELNFDVKLRVSGFHNSKKKIVSDNYVTTSVASQISEGVRNELSEIPDDYVVITHFNYENVDINCKKDMNILVEDYIRNNTNDAFVAQIDIICDSAQEELEIQKALPSIAAKYKYIGSKHGYINITNIGTPDRLNEYMN